MKKLNEIFKRWENQNPNPKTELEYKNLYTLLVAVVLSAQATDNSVNKATKSLFDLYDTPEKFLLLGEDGLKNYIKNIGLFNNKAKNIIALSKILVEKYNSEVPENFEDLILLPGVGRKTANVVLNCWFNKNVIPVDTHIYRVSKRLGFSSSNSVDGVEKDLMKIIPRKYIVKSHHWMILHGRYICRARNPICEKCVISDLCESDDKKILSNT